MEIPPLQANKQETEKLSGWRLGVAKNGDLIVVDPVAAQNAGKEFFVDTDTYLKQEDAEKALLAYKLRFALFLSATDRCKIAYWVEQTIKRE